MSFRFVIKKLNGSAKPLLAVLIDPDKYNEDLIAHANKSKVACFLVGGSKLEKGNIHKTIQAIKKISNIPVILFPGDETQLSAKADGLFLPSLLSGRNPEYLIEKQIKMAPLIRKMQLKHLPMAYLLIDGNKTSSTQKVTNTNPLSIVNQSYIINTAIAAEQLGFKLLYLEAGSGAQRSIAASLIKKIKKEISIPIIVGGGIDSPKKIKEAIQAGANMIVVGNALEKNVHLLTDMSSCF